jgi:uncharacterized membrane protein YhaH (DUF805 family)
MQQFFSGSIGRLSYSLGLVGIVFSTVGIFIFSNVTRGKYLVPVLLILGILLVISCAITAKRLRSIGLKGTYTWLVLIPYLGTIMQLLLLFWRPKSTPGNRTFIITLITITISLIGLISAYFFIAAILDLPSYLDRNHVN